VANWRPLSEREEPTGGWAGPFEGVPDWLFGPLAGWVSDRYPLRGEGRVFRREAIAEYRRLAMALRISLEDPADANPVSGEGHRERFLQMARGRPTLLLDAADHWLSLGLAEWPPNRTAQSGAPYEGKSTLKRLVVEWRCVTT
jgi:hypothetical protein